MTDLDKLRALAEAATPGPWEATTSEATMNDRSQYRFGVKRRPAVFFGHQMRSADAAFVEATDPAVVLVLLDRIEAVEKLHYRIEVEPSESICAACSTRRGTGKNVRYFPYAEWPCPTLRAARGLA